MKFTIEHVRGMWKAELDGRCEFGYSLEDLLQKLDPHAPVEYIAHTTEILSGILGIEYLPVLEWMAALDEGGMTQEQWDASFAPGRSLVDELLEERRAEAAHEEDPDEFPRGV